MQVSHTETHESDASTVITPENAVASAQSEHWDAVPARKSEVDAEIESLVQTLQVENRKTPLRFGISVAIAILLVQLVQALLNRYLHIHVTFVSNLWIVWVVVGGVFAPTRLQKATARRLAQFDDIRAVGPLTEALDRQDRATKGAASAAIARLLPRMKARDSALLNSRQRDYLLAGLKKGSRDLKVAVLKALPEIGDERFLKEVAAMSEGRGSAKRDAHLRDAAKVTIEPLRHIVEAERIRMTLLRPAEESPATADNLLRPAGGASGDDSHLLQTADSPQSPNPPTPLPASTVTLFQKECATDRPNPV